MLQLLLLHYIAVQHSFEYAQQFHLHSNPQQPGPIYFLVPRSAVYLACVARGFLGRQMPPIVNDPVAWSVGLSLSEPCRKFLSDRDTVCIQDSGGPREIPITYSGPLWANTVLCSFNTIQPSSSCLSLS